MDPESHYPISLHPKLLISLDDPVGVSLGLSSICVTSMGAFHSVFDHLTTTSNVGSASNGRLNDSTRESKHFDSYHRAPRELRLIPNSKAVFRHHTPGRRDFDSNYCSSSDNPDALPEPNSQRRRRKQQLPRLDEPSRAESRFSEEMVVSFQPVNGTTLSSSLDHFSPDNYSFPSTDSHEPVHVISVLWIISANYFALLGTHDHIGYVQHQPASCTYSKAPHLSHPSQPRSRSYKTVRRSHQMINLSPRM
ncbi:unnamed protein product [Dicrocoelium dendriticum]|nr:unnamed protein product [Dicrocoelium dendriticum]